MAQLPAIDFLSFGKPKQMWRPILDVYETRLAKATKFRHVILREKGEGADAVKAGADKQIATYVDDNPFVLVFDERGKAMTSVAFATMLANVRPRRLVAIIGTSYGLSDQTLAAADRKVGLGPMTLPHEIARATALEQIYRAETILTGHPYHHA
jgi:23S rRNA (pseudouridine1915-N3)-methyltransferase